MTYATLKIDGTYAEFDGVPTLEQMQEAVAGPQQERGYIERVQLAHGVDLWLNEEGKFECPEENAYATRAALRDGGIAITDYIAGNVMFTGGADKEGETLGLNDVQRAYVRDVCAP